MTIIYISIKLTSMTILLYKVHSTHNNSKFKENNLHIKYNYIKLNV